jgi:cell division protein FtsB
MKNRIIVVLTLLLLTLFAVFQSHKLKNAKNSVDRLQRQVEIIIRENESNLNDMIKLNREKIDAEKKANLLQAKLTDVIEKDEKSNTCLSRSIPVALRKFMRNNTM